MLNEDEARPRLKTLRCRRTGRFWTPTEHAGCPYCFGEEKEVETGRYEDFCDAKPGEDPLTFGRPSDADRYRTG